MLDELGYEIVDEFLSKHEHLDLLDALTGIELPDGAGGIRNINQKSDGIGQFVLSENLVSRVNRYLPHTGSLVRAILFHKNLSHNWLVPWHQDKTVAVSCQFDKQGWGPWSLKDGIHHVQPPLEVLHQMVAIRIHIDDCNKDNGCLKVIPSSHHEGILTASQIERIVSNKNVVECVVPARSAIIMKPHLLHASSKVSVPSQRRILHLEYSWYTLPNGVNWT